MTRALDTAYRWWLDRYLDRPVDWLFKWGPLAGAVTVAGVCFAVAVWAARLAGRTDGLGRLTQ